MGWKTTTKTIGTEAKAENWKFLKLDISYIFMKIFLPIPYKKPNTSENATKIRTK